MLVTFVVPLVFAIGITIPGVFAPDGSTGAPVLSTVSNIATFTGIILSWLTGVAVFSLVETDHEIADVFA